MRNRSRNIQISYEEAGYSYHDLKKLKLMIARGYEHARQNRPELPPSYSFREVMSHDIKVTQAQNKAKE